LFVGAKGPTRGQPPIAAGLRIGELLSSTERAAVLDLVGQRLDGAAYDERARWSDQI